MNSTPPYEPKLQRKKRAMLLMAITAIMWSIAGIFIKLISWNPLMIAGLRSLIAGAVLGLYMVWRHIPFKFCKASAGAGVGLGVSASLFVIANKLTTAANAIVLQYSCPIFILLITALVFRRRLRKREIVVVTITMCGIVLFFFDQLSPGNALGNILGIFSGVFLAVMFVSMGEGADDDSIRMSGILMAHGLAAAAGLPVGAWLTAKAWAASQGAWGDPQETGLPADADLPADVAGAAAPGGFWDALSAAVTGQELLWILILGIFQLGIPYVLYAVASRDCPPLACSLIGMLEPLFNPVWVAIFAGEIPGPFAFAGGTVIILTIAWWCVVENRSETGKASDARPG